MSSAAVDIFKAWGEFSPDIEEFDLLIAALVPRDRAPSKKCSRGLVLRVKMSHGFLKLSFLWGLAASGAVWLGRAFLSGTGLLRGARLTAVAFLTGTGLLRGARLTVWRLGVDRITVWQEDRHC